MPRGLATGQRDIPRFIETLVAQGVVQKTTTAGEILLELYSLLECLEPDPGELSACLQHVRFVVTREDVLGLYLVYIPLADVLAHVVPACQQRWVEDIG